jgi:RHS repeat-associated protein
LTSKSYSDSTPAVSYFFDQTSYNGLSITNGKGRRTGMSDGSGATAWNYDPLGHVLTERKTIAGTTKNTSYTYNVNGTLSSITYPNGHTITYTYNNAAQQTSALDSANNTQYALSATYSPQGALSSVVRGQVSGGFSGITETYTFNNLLQGTGIQASSSNGTALGLTYSFNPAGNDGNVATETNSRVPGRSQSWTYDGLSRIATAQSQDTSGPNCWGQSFGYDRWANLLSIGVLKCSATALSVSVNGHNQITNTGFSYDSAGRMLGDGTYTLGYDAENHLISAAGVSYVYDGNGFRVKKSNGILYWRNTGGDSLVESDLSGNTINEYIYFAGALIATRSASGSVNYTFSDRLGSVRVATDSLGHICFDSDFYPFGGEINYVNSCPQNYKFTGYERDSETGFDYALYRVYDSRIGRFTAPDVNQGALTSSQTLNRYAYAADNPVSLTDLSGLAPRDQHQYLTFLMAALIGRSDAASIAQGAGTADNFFNATTGLIGLGYFVNFSKHFGIPCTDGDGCASGGFALGFQLHDVEDIGADGPHDLQGSYGVWSRVLDSLQHIWLNVDGRSPDRDVERVVAGMDDAWQVLNPGGKAGPFPWDAMEFIVGTVDSNQVSIVGVQLIRPDGSSTSSPGFDLTNATLIDSGVYNGLQINIYKLPGISFYSDPNVQAILTQNSLPGADPMAEAQALYIYSVYGSGSPTCSSIFGWGATSALSGSFIGPPCTP